MAHAPIPWTHAVFAILGNRVPHLGPCAGLQAFDFVDQRVHRVDLVQFFAQGRSHGNALPYFRLGIGSLVDALVARIPKATFSS